MKEQVYCYTCEKVVSADVQVKWEYNPRERHITWTCPHCQQQQQEIDDGGEDAIG